MSDLVTPSPGDVWSDRHRSRRVRVLNVWQSGRIQVKSVIPAGKGWNFEARACSTSIDGRQFLKRFRLLARGLPPPPDERREGNV